MPSLADSFASESAVNDELTLIIEAFEIIGVRAVLLATGEAGEVLATDVTGAACCARLRRARAMGTSEIKTNAAAPQAHKSRRCMGRFHHPDLEFHIVVIDVGNRRDSSSA